jgi:hypothetical protein
MMNKFRILMDKFRIILLISLVFLLTAATFIAATPSIDWWHIGGGGSTVTQGNMALDGLADGGVIGVSSQAGKELCSG